MIGQAGKNQVPFFRKKVFSWDPISRLLLWDFPVFKETSFEYNQKHKGLLRRKCTIQNIRQAS